MSKNLSVILVFLLPAFLFPLSSVGQDEAEWKRRADSITAGCKTSYEKAKAIYLWEVRNIEYDHNYKIYSAKNCWRMRKGVCQAYSDLFVALAKGCGVQAHSISGKCQTAEFPNGDGPHVWVAAKTEKGTILIDPTWGADDSPHATMTQLMVWFDVKPECMIFAHFPNNPKDQMLATPLTEEQYRSLPNLNPILVQRGWNAAAVLSYFLNHPGERAPQVYNNGAGFEGVQIVQAPYGRTLYVGKTYTFKIRCTKPGYTLQSDKGKWVKDGNLYTLVLRPTEEGRFSISIKINNSYVSSMDYNMVNP